MGGYELYLCSGNGERLAGPLTSLLELEWSVGLGMVGAVKATFGEENWDPLWLDSTLRLEVWRTARAGEASLVQVFFLKDYGEKMASGRAGTRELAWVRGYDLNDLLKRRIIAADAGSAGASKTGFAADVMAAYADEALLTDVGRDIAAGLALTIVYTSGDGADIECNASRKNLLTTLVNCANLSEASGTAIRFWIEPVTAGVARLRISPLPFGADRRNATPFSAEAGTLYDAHWEYRSGEAGNYAYVGGRGEGADRVVGETSIGEMTALTRCEVWYENSQLALEASLQDWGLARLWQQRARYLFGATLRDTELAAFGQDWGLGDLVRADYGGRVWEAEIIAVAGKFDEREDTIQAILAAEANVEV